MQMKLTDHSNQREERM